MYSTSTKKKRKDNCFPRENVSTEVTSLNRKKPEVAGSLTSGCVKAALQLFVLFFFFIFVELDCKKGENSSVAMPLSLSSTSHLSSYLTLPVVGEGKNTFNSNSTELLLASAPKSSKIFTGEVPAFFSKEQYEVSYLLSEKVNTSSVQVGLNFCKDQQNYLCMIGDSCRLLQPSAVTFMISSLKARMQPVSGSKPGILYFPPVFNGSHWFLK